MIRVHLLMQIKGEKDHNCIENLFKLLTLTDLIILMSKIWIDSNPCEARFTKSSQAPWSTLSIAARLPEDPMCSL